MVIQGVSYLSDFEAKKAVIEAARRLEAKGFLTAGDGSLSVRVGPNAVWVTLEGADKAALTQDMLVRVDLNGKQMMSAHLKPLAEDLAVHLKIYRENESVQCVLHAYPPCAVALSRRGQGLPAADYSPSVRKLGRIQLLGAQSAEALPQAAASLSRTDRGVLLQNDGCMLWGKNPLEVCHLAEAMAYCCKVNAAMGRCSVCSKCARCGNSIDAPAEHPTAQTVYSSPAPQPAAAPLSGVTGLIQPGQSLPPLPQPGQSASPAAPPVQEAPAMKPGVAAVDVPKADVMAEVVRRTLQSF